MFRKVKDWVKTHKTAFALIVTALFVAAHIPLILTHENWNDEAVSWALSREINITNIYEINNAEPHPLLWQLILAPFSKLGLPFDTISYISLALVAFAVFLFIRFAPMNGFVKFTFLISAGFFYFLPVISRDYSLIPLAIALVCIAYKSRHEKPFLYGLAVAFLTQTHFLMYGFAAALGVGFVIEEIVKKEEFSKRLKRTAIFALPIAISLASVIPIVINSFNNQAIISGVAYESTDPDVLEQFAPNALKGFFGSNTEAIYIITIILAALFSLGLLAKNIKAFFYFAIGEGFWIYVMSSIYKGYYVIEPKTTLIVLMIIAVVWIAKLEETDNENIVSKLLGHSEIIRIIKKKKICTYPILAVIIALVTVPHTFAFAKRDLNQPFSNSKEVSSILNDFEDGALIIQADPAAVVETAVREYVERDLVYYNLMNNKVDEVNNYLKYDNSTITTYKNFENITNEELNSLLYYSSNVYEHVYYIAQRPSCGYSYSNANADILNKLELIATLNLGNDTHLDIPRPIVDIYKVK